MNIKCGRPAKGCEKLSKERLLETARQLLLANSYANLTLDMVAKEAKVSLRTLYNLFDGKEGLFRALVKCDTDALENILSDCDNCTDTLSHFGCVYLKNVTQPEIIRLRAVLLAEAPRFPELVTEFYGHGPANTLRLLAEFFRRKQSEGVIAAELDATFLADQYLSLLRGERYYRLQLGLELTPAPETIKLWASEAAELFLKGCIIR